MQIVKAEQAAIATRVCALVIAKMDNLTDLASSHLKPGLSKILAWYYLH